MFMPEFSLKTKILYNRAVFRPVIPFFLLNGSIINQRHRFLRIWNLFIIWNCRQTRSIWTVANLFIWWGITMNSNYASSRTSFPNLGTSAQKLDSLPLRFHTLPCDVVAMFPLSQFSGLTRAVVVASCFGI